MRASVLFVVMALGLVACGGDDDDTTSPPPEVPDIPDDSDAVVAQFTSGGGIAGPCCDPWVLPELTVYGDGRALVAGDQVVRQANVSPTEVAALFADAAEAGLLDDDPPDAGTLCCDLGDTIVVLADETGTHQVSVVGLGAEGNANADLTTEQRSLRQAVLDLHSGLDRLVQESDDVDDYTPTELAAYVFPGEAGPGVEVPPWPLAGSLAEGCLHITTGVDKVLDAAADGTTWMSASRPWHVILRPLLPHEHTCP
jgi:hypothetical protein